MKGAMPAVALAVRALRTLRQRTSARRKRPTNELEQDLKLRLTKLLVCNCRDQCNTHRRIRLWATYFALPMMSAPSSAVTSARCRDALATNQSSGEHR